MRLPSDVLRQLLREPTRAKLPPSRERAAINRLHVLQAVAEHGHLRCTDLAAACWPRAAYGEQMAQRTVRALIEAGHLKARTNALGSGQSVVLTRSGAAALEVRGIAAHHGLDLAVCGATFRHGALTSRWCIHKQAQGFQAFTECAIANGRAPLSREALFKRLGCHVDSSARCAVRVLFSNDECRPRADALGRTNFALTPTGAATLDVRHRRPPRRRPGGKAARPDGALR